MMSGFFALLPVRQKMLQTMVLFSELPFRHTNIGIVVDLVFRLQYYAQYQSNRGALQRSSVVANQPAVELALATRLSR